MSLQGIMLVRAHQNGTIVLSNFGNIATVRCGRNIVFNFRVPRGGTTVLLTTEK